jgi:hypothetical protein
METSSQISKEILGAQIMCNRDKFPASSSCKAMRVKPKKQWKPQEFRDGRNVESAKECHKQ